jgi:DNA-binding transcriptional ArsR family regulator
MDILTLSRALSSPSRLYLLQSMGETGMSVAELAAASGLVPSTVCFHARQLVEVGLAVKKRRGRRSIYRWSPTRVSIHFEEAPLPPSSSSATP